MYTPEIALDDAFILWKHAIALKVNSRQAIRNLIQISCRRSEVLAGVG